MENNKKKKSVKFQGGMFNFCDFIQVFVFTTNHHLKLGTFVIFSCFTSKLKEKVGGLLGGGGGGGGGQRVCCPPPV